MSSFPGLTAQFNEPTTDDTTAAPSEPAAPQVAVPKIKKPLKARNPGALAGAIARAKRAKQPTYKYGG